MNWTLLTSLLAGVFFILAFLIWRRHVRQSIVGEQLPPQAGNRLEPLNATPAVDEWDVIPIEKYNRRIEPTLSPAPPAPATHSTPPQELVVLLGVLAPTGQRFAGTDVRQALEAAGLTFGAMRIFHYYSADDSSSPLFSAANMIEPGYLDEDTLAASHTPGITLFMQLPSEQDASASFARMYSAATAIAAQLGGQVCDAARQPLSTAALERQRRVIHDFQQAHPRTPGPQDIRSA